MLAVLLAVAGACVGGLAQAVDVTLVPVEGDELTGPLTVLEPQAGVTVKGRTVKLDEIAEIRFGGAPVGAKDKPRIRLRNGNVLHAAILAGDDKALRVHSALLGDLALKNDLILGVSFPVKEPPSDEALAQFFAEAKADQDQLLTPKGETIGCFLEKFTEKELAIESGGQKRALPLDQVAAFRYAALKPFPAATGVQALVRLGDGSLLSGRLTGFSGGKVALQSADGTPWALPAAAIRSVGFKGGKLVFLSDLEPRAEERTLVGGAPVLFRWRKDAAVTGERLRLGRRDYLRGLGVHAYCKLTFALGGQYARLLADVGLDAGAASGAVCSWKVVADGKELEHGEARAGGEPRKLALNVAGAKVLELICDFGPDRDDAGDHLDWADARLLRE